MMKSKLNGILAVMAGGALAAGFALAPALASANGTDTMHGARAKQAQKYGELTQAKVDNVISHYKATAGELENYFNDAYGYAVFPSIGAGPRVVGDHYGAGAVYKSGKLVGHATVTKLPMGAHSGGQTFSEVIFFQNKHAFDLFTNDKYHFQGNATGAEIRSGVHITTPSTQYSNGLAVFVNTKSGAKAGVMTDKIKIGGQKFVYNPVGGKIPTTP